MTGKRLLERKRILKKMYRKQKCSFVKASGIQCKLNAVGSSQMCKKHGGSRVVPGIGFKTNEVPMVMGSNSLYRSNQHPLRFIDLSRRGLSLVEIAAEFSVGVGTLEGWAEKYQDMGVAFEIGQALHEAWWLSTGKEGLDSRTFNTSLFKFLTGNKLGYADKIESKNLNLNANMCGVLSIPAKMDADEWSASFDE